MSPLSKTFRETKQRQALKSVLKEAGRPLQAREIYEQASAIIPQMGLATVYRNLKVMVDAGVLEVIELPGPLLYYTLQRSRRKPLLICRQTQTVHIMETAEGVNVPEGLPQSFHTDGFEVIYVGNLRSLQEVE